MGQAVARQLGAVGVRWPRRLSGYAVRWPSSGVRRGMGQDYIDLSVTPAASGSPSGVIGYDTASGAPIYADGASIFGGNVPTVPTGPPIGTDYSIGTSIVIPIPAAGGSVLDWLGKSTVISGTQNSTVLLGGLAVVALLGALSGGKRRR